ncbi:cation:proton antiporter [Candidatus Woesearchaeota archaeon]|nr:cation:proton antiporter [Candidatus Woesearchaeota archaeon]
MANLVFEIGAVIIIATLLAYIANLVRQPIVLGYLLAGFVIGPAAAGLITSTETIALLSELGIALMLFIVGLEIDVTKLRNSGTKAAIMGVGQAVFTSIAGFGIAKLFGFSHIASFYIAVALAMSSTMIVVKLLSDKAQLDTMYGRIIVGILLVQDIAAIMILALLPSIGSSSLQLIGASLLKGVIILAAAFIAAKTLLPLLFRASAKSTELLFLSAVSWLFAFAFFSEFLGYSMAIGSFIAGVTLASSSFKLEIDSRVKPLRDFFATIFFVSLGMQLALPSLSASYIAVIVFSLFVIIGNPVIVAALGMLLGYNKRISIMTAIPIGQISEFSLILVALGVSLGHIAADIAAIVVAVAAITITSTTYVVKYDEQFYRMLSRAFRFKPARDAPVEKSGVDAVICGYNSIGHSIAKKLQQLRKSFVVVDYDPDVISRLQRQRIPAVYGDLGDAGFVEKLNIPEAQLVVSTLPYQHENELIIKEAAKGRAAAFVTANKIETALKLYNAGASYVIMPQFLGGEHVAGLLDNLNAPAIMQNKFSHMRELYERQAVIK